jgi:hypothetical protein
VQSIYGDFVWTRFFCDVGFATIQPRAEMVASFKSDYTPNILVQEPKCYA